MNIESKLKELGIEIPPATRPVGSYSTAVQVGELVFLSGIGPASLPGVKTPGRIGENLTVEDGYLAARATAVNLLANLKGFLGDLDRGMTCIKMTGYVNCIPAFTQQAEVINGATDLLIELFGERGKPARVAIGVASLPFGIPIEIDLIVAVDEKQPQGGTKT